MKKEIDELRPFTIIGANGKIITVNYVCIMTMLDGKIKCILSDVSNNGRCNCWICGATPSEMAYLKGIKHDFKPSPKALLLGIAPLHSAMRAFDYICKYKFHEDFRSWSCR